MDAGDAAAEIDAAIRGRRGLIVVVMTMIMMMIMVVMRVEMMRVVVAMTVIVVMMIVIVRMIMVVAVIVAVVMTVMVGMAVRLAGSHAAVSASANRAHQSTSNSLIRNSSPAVTCN